MASVSQGVADQQELLNKRIDALCDQYDAVLLATGANDPRTIALKGMSTGTAIEGLNFMKRYNDKTPIEIKGNVEEREAVSAEDLAQLASEHYQEYLRLTGEGKLAEAGEHLEALGAVLDQLLEE